MQSLTASTPCEPFHSICESFVNYCNLLLQFTNDFRCVYFANHFFNYYHVAPMDEIYEYIESLALWGQSVLSLWFDMHHFSSFSSPDACIMLERMKMMYQKAKSLGMKTALLHVINEYYDSAPYELRAENSTADGRYHAKPCGFFESQICPSHTEGEKLLLTSLAEVLKYFSPVGLDYCILWPYDQGGCTCKKCYPWGGNGFYKLAKKQAPIIKAYFPDCKIILSCWYFDLFTHGEWEQIIPKLESDGDWIDLIMINLHSNHPVALQSLGKPIVSFIEISMRGATPWGGFGVNPYPNVLASDIRSTDNLFIGGSLYSEGIFEDINKVVSLELLRDPLIEPEQIIHEYCRYHFGEANAPALTEIIICLERTLGRHTYVDDQRNEYPSEKPKSLNRYHILNHDEVQMIADRFREIDTQIPEEIKKQWRYEQIFARVFGDELLLKNNGFPSEETDVLYQELVHAYHAEKAYYFVSPITRESILENRGEGV